MALLVAGLVLPAKTVCAGNSFQTASTFQLGTRVSHTYTETDQTEFYKFTTPAGNGYYSLTLYNVNNGAYKYISIYDSPSFDGSKVLDKYMYSNGNETTVMRLLPNRTYPAAFKAKYNGWWSQYAALSWTYKEGYHGYQIWRSSTSSTKGFKKIKTISTTTSSSSSYNDTKVKRGKTYYYKMRYYVKDNGKLYYSKWTKVKKVKIKK